jgi:hypothetical protein
MPLQQKQYADLVRHRELNALRRLMSQRFQVPSFQSASPQSPQSSQFQLSQALNQINALEAQMNQEMVERGIKTGFAHTRLLPSHEPTPSIQSNNPLTEAAIYFASNEMAVSQKLLEKAIHTKGNGQEHIPTWLALFDLYRATDQSAPFDNLALDFSIRFGRTAPGWVSLPSLAEVARLEHAHPAQQKAAEIWISPEFLTLATTKQLETNILLAADRVNPFSMDWRSLVSVEPTVWSELRKTLNKLASLKIRCNVYGLATLKQAISLNYADAALTQLALLRCENLEDEFVDKAIAYCTAFEISPPDWVAPQCELLMHDKLFMETSPQTATKPISDFELFGHIESQLPAAFEKALGSQSSLGIVVIRCERLIRISPIGITLLIENFKKANAKNVQIELDGVHRLIAAFLIHKDVHQYAKVIINTN